MLFRSREELVSDLPTEEDSMQVSPVSISECDAVRSAISDSNFNDQAYLVLNSEKENFSIEIIDRVFDPNALMSSEQSLHKEIIQSVNEK